MTTCPCNLAVPLDYSVKSRIQAEVALAMIEKLGEWTTVTVGPTTYHVSRHCIALHGIKAEEIDQYGFAEVPLKGGDR